MHRLHILFVLVAGLLSHHLSGAEKPNVLFLAVDDMNDWIGCHETTPRAFTPNFDKLAARGVNFTNAHTAGVFCAPFSGGHLLWAIRVHHRLLQLRPLLRTPPPRLSRSRRLSPKLATRPTALANSFIIRQAPSTPAIGPHFFLRNPAQRTTGWPLDSFSPEVPFPTPFPHSPFNQDREITGGLFLEWGPVPNDREEDMADTQRINWAVQALENQPADKPFFLAVGLYAPHFPNYCPQKYFDLYDPDKITTPPYKKDDLDDLPPHITKIKTNRSRIHQRLEELDAVDDAIHGYLACISYADALMGRVLNALENSPHYQNTIVVPLVGPRVSSWRER